MTVDALHERGRFHSIHHRANGGHHIYITIEVSERIEITRHPAA
jgi:hypothetical protein